MAKRILALLLAVLMVAALATGCSSGSSEGGNGDAPALLEDGSIDLGVKRSISLIIDQNTFITDYNDNYLTNMLEEKYNCDIDVDVLPAGDDGKTKLQLMINGGDKLPDIFSTNNVNSALMYEYGSGGTFIALNEYYDNEKLMPNFNAIESEDDKVSMKAAASSADGNIYCLTRFEPEPWNLTPYRMYINTKWLENLNMEMPTTTEELYDVLNAFANEDPNGNGSKDEIAVFTHYTDNGGYGNNVILPLINSFVFTNTSMSGFTLSDDGKTVIAPQVSEGWQDAMKYLRSLAECGAIDPASTFVYDATAYKSALNYQGIGTEEAPEGKSVNIVGLASLGSNSGQFPDSGRDENVNFNEYWLMPVCEGPDGLAYSPFAGYTPACNWFITEDAADPAFCVFLGDALYEFDMSMTVRFGVEEEDWTADPQKCADWYTEHTKLIEAAGYTQPKSEYAQLQLNSALWSDSNNKFWHNIQPRYMSLERFDKLGTWYDPETFKYYRANNLNPTNQEYYYDKHPKYILPALSYTKDEQEQITEIQIQYPELITEWTMYFITGEKDPEKDWEEYVKTLNDNGLQTYLTNAQAAYERTVYYAANFG